MKFLTDILKENSIEPDKKIIDAISSAIKENYISKAEHEGVVLDNHLKLALLKSGAKSDKAISGFIDRKLLKIENGVLTGLDSQLTEIKKSHSYLFEEQQGNTGFNHQSGMSIDYDSLSDEEYYKLKSERN